MEVTKQQFQFGAILAAISAIVGVLSAIVALYIQVSNAVDPIISARIRQDFAPVGTIVSSVLPPPLFAAATGEIEGDDFKKRKWLLADGRSVNGTEYAKKTNDKPIPDLRGMFLRGIDPRGRRGAGEFEDFATALPTAAFKGATTTDGTHSHPGVMVPGVAGDRYNAGGTNYFVPGPSRTGADGAHNHIFEVTEGGDEETRPRNIAVYYYIKIN